MTTKTYEGGCSCRSIRYRIRLPSEQPFPQLVLCHCSNCKLNSGSAFSCNLVIPTRALELFSGTPKIFLDGTDEGPYKPRRQFCGDCGTPLTSEPGRPSEIISIKWGTLDDPKPRISVGQEVYCRSRDEFLAQLSSDGVARFDGKMEGALLNSLTMDL